MISLKEAVAVAGFSRWETAHDVYQKMTVDKAEEGQMPVDAVRNVWPSLLRPLVKEEYIKRRNGVEVEVLQVCQGQVKDEVMLAGGKLLAVRTVSAFVGDEYGEDGGSVLPPEDEAYVLAALSLCPENVVSADVAVLVGGTDFRVLCVGRDDEVGEEIVRKANAFVDFVLDKGIEPPVDETVPIEGRILELAARVNGMKPKKSELLPPTPESDVLLQEYADVLAESEAVEKRLEEMKLRVKAFIGEADGVIASNGMKATFKKKTGKSVDWKGLASELGVSEEAIVAKTTVKESREFRFYIPKKK